jgi:hypothetical protein
VGDLEKATHHLNLLPAPEDCPTPVQALAKSAEKPILRLYYSTVNGVNFLRPNLEAFQAAEKAYLLAGVPPERLAAHIGLGFHFAGIDSKALQIYVNALSEPLHNDERVRTAAIALDQWCRISRSEQDYALSKALTLWGKTYPKNPVVQTVVLLESARSQVRGARNRNPQDVLQRVLTLPDNDERFIPSSLLLLGLLQHQKGDHAEARATFLKGIESATAVKSRSPFHLADLIVLHCLTKTWDRETVLQVMGGLVGSTKTSGPAAMLQAAFISTFLATDEYVASLNASADDPETMKFAIDYATRSQNARTLSNRWFRLMLERYFHAGITAPTAKTISPQVQDTVKVLLDFIATGKGQESDFFAYLSAWNDPAALVAMVPRFEAYPASLVTRLKWLLAQRYLHTSHPKDALKLLSEVKDSPHLDELWLKTIAGQMAEIAVPEQN